MAADQAPRRERRRPPQPGEHRAGVGAQRARRSSSMRASARVALTRRAPTKAGRDEGGAHRRALLRPGLDLRAQARRHPLHRDPRRRRGAAALAQRPVAERPLPGGRRGAGGAAGARFAVDGEVVAFDGGADELLRLARRGRERVPVFLYVFDLLVARRRATCARCRCATASGCCATRSTSADPIRFTHAPQPRRRGVLRRGLPQGLGGADRQAGRQPLRRPRARATGSSSSASAARSW